MIVHTYDEKLKIYIKDDINVFNYANKLKDNLNNMVVDNNDISYVEEMTFDEMKGFILENYNNKDEEISLIFDTDKYLNSLKEFIARFTPNVNLL